MPSKLADAFGLKRNDERKKGAGAMMNRYFVNIERIEPAGVMLTVEALPRLLIFGESPDEALGRAREAIGFQLRDSIRDVARSAVELVPRQPST